MTTKGRPPVDDVDPDAPPTADELRGAGDLRAALEDPGLENDAAALARALVLAHAPREIDQASNRALVERALHAPRVVSWRVRGRARAWGAAGAFALAIAASALAVVRSQEGPVASRVEPEGTIHARSTSPLFREPFGPHGSASARIDRIASARGADLRENMFARWEVQ